MVTSLKGFLCGAVVKNPPVSAGDARDLGYSRVRKISWSRRWQPTPVFLHGEFHGQRSLMGYSPLGSQLDMTELLSMHTYLMQSPQQHWTYLYIWKNWSREVNHFKSYDNLMANLRSWYFKPFLLLSHSGSPESCILTANWQTEASRTQQTHKRREGTQWGKGKVERIKRARLTDIHYHVENR